MATKTHLEFSADKKSCWIVFASGSESLELENMNELFRALKTLKEKGRITEEEINNILDQSLESEMTFVDGKGIVSTGDGSFAILISKEEVDETYMKFFNHLRTATINYVLQKYKDALIGKDLPGFYACPTCKTKDHWHICFDDHISPPVTTKAEARKLAEEYLEDSLITIGRKVLIDLQIDHAPIPEYSWLN